MPANAKTKKLAKMPSDLPQDGLKELLLEIASSLQDARTVDDRRELVAKLLSRQVRRSRIVAICTKAFGISSDTVDADIRWAKDWMTDAVTKMNLEALRGECIASMNEVIAQGFGRSDLNAVVSATKHKAQLLGLTDEGLNVTTNIIGTDQIHELRSKLERRLFGLVESKEARKVLEQPDSKRTRAPK